MKFLRSKKGFTVIELVVTMAIMGILSMSVAGLVRTGLSSYKHISSDMSYETEARAALSLITVQIRQHDETDAIAVDSANKKIKLKDAPGNSAGTIIWFEDGTVYSVKTRQCKFRAGSRG